MPEYLAPGVFVEEVDTGSKPIEGVSTSTAGIIGVSERGPVGVPILVTSFGEFTRWFGGLLNRRDFSLGRDHHCYLPDAVQGFFSNGGKRLYIVRVLDSAGAARAATRLFGRAAAGAADTVLLRSAGQQSGTAANPPPLYVLDVGAAAVGDWLRVGEGSTAEYRRVAARGTVATNTHVALSFPLAGQHAQGDNVEQFARVTNGPALTIVPDDTGTLPAPGDAVVTVQGTAAEITALLAPPIIGQLLELGGASGEHRFIVAVTQVTPTTAAVQLSEPLVLTYDQGASAQRLTAGAGAPTTTLAQPAGPGDRLVFVVDRQGQFDNPARLVRVLGAVTEVRRIGALGRVALPAGTYEEHSAGSVVEAVTFADDRRVVQAAPPPTTTQVQLDDVRSLAVGQILEIGAERAVIRSIAPDPPPAVSGLVTFAAPLTAAPAAAAVVMPAARTLTAMATAGTFVIALSNRLGLASGDLVRIDTGADRELIAIAALQGSSSGVAPDAGSVVLAAGLRRDHAAGTEVQRQITPPARRGAPPNPTVTALDAAAAAPMLVVTDATGYVATEARVTTPTGEAFFYDVGPTPAAVTTATVTLTEALQTAHGAGAPVLERPRLLGVEAIDAGSWGDRLQVATTDEPAGLVFQASLRDMIDPTHIRLGSPLGVEVGTVVELQDPDGLAPIDETLLKVTRIDRTSNNTITLAGPLSAAQLAAHAAATAAGRRLRVRSREFRLDVELRRQPDPAQPARDELVIASESHRNLSMDPRHSRYVQTVIGDSDPAAPVRLSDHRSEGDSWYVRVHDVAQDLAEPARTTALESIRLGPENLVDVLPNGTTRPARRRFTGGDDSLGTLTDATYVGVDAPDPENRTGLQSLRNVDEVSIVAAPGRTGVAIQSALIDHCELLRYRFAVLDSQGPPGDTLADVQTQRHQFDTKYAALYYPWPCIADPFPVNPAQIADDPIPPSGHVLGTYARTDNQRGVHKAPANEVLRGGIVRLRRTLTTGDQEIINPGPENINALRDFRLDNRGIRIWGARVITSDPDWKYVNVRRLIIFIEKSIDVGLQWVVFEVNSEPLWARVRRSVANFLTTVWRNGALEGTRPEEAYFVKCDRTTMTQADIDNGRLICVIGVAPVKPAEFVIIRIGLWTAHADD